MDFYSGQDLPSKLISGTTVVLRELTELRHRTDFRWLPNEIEKNTLSILKKNLTDSLSLVHTFLNVQSPTQRIPREILVQIIQQSMQDVSDDCLDTDLLRYSGVCRYWRDTMMISPQLWCRVIMHGKSTRFINYLDLKISRSSSHNLKLVILRLTDLTTGWLSCMPVEVFNRLSWVEFSDRVEFPPDIAIRLISRTLPSLKHICISSSKLRRRMGSADISRISHLLHSNAPRINSFTLRNAGALPEASNLHVLSGLTALNLDFTEVLTKRSILAMFQILVVNNSLETLHINCKKAHYKYRDVVPVSRDDSSPVLAITPPTEVPTPVVLSRLRSIHLLHCTSVFIHRVLDKLELPYGCLIDVFPTKLRGEAVDKFDIRNILPKRYLNKSGITDFCLLTRHGLSPNVITHSVYIPGTRYNIQIGTFFPSLMLPDRGTIEVLKGVLVDVQTAWFAFTFRDFILFDSSWADPFSSVRTLIISIEADRTSQLLERSPPSYQSRLKDYLDFFLIPSSLTLRWPKLEELRMFVPQHTVDQYSILVKQAMEKRETITGVAVNLVVDAIDKFPQWDPEHKFVDVDSPDDQ